MTSLSITILYLPYTIINWRDLSASDLHRLTELILYNGVAVILGVLKRREQKEQERLREAESLSAMGRALSAVAHDMKAPLIAIGGFARLVQKHVESKNPYRDKLDIVIRETARMESMVNEMLDFSRPLTLHPADQNAHSLIEETVAVIEGLARERNVTVRNDSPPRPPAISIDTVRIKQLLINLVTNAVQASPEGGMVIVRCNIRGGELVIDVADQGSGIPVDKRDEIFTPFVSPKKDGTGLGLAIVKKIVDAHQGRIEVQDTPHGGTTFRVILPV
jgi:two-component system sensor histidine kinase HydH